MQIVVILRIQGSLVSTGAPGFCEVSWRSVLFTDAIATNIVPESRYATVHHTIGLCFVTTWSRRWKDRGRNYTPCAVIVDIEVWLPLLYYLFSFWVFPRYVGSIATYRNFPNTNIPSRVSDLVIRPVGSMTRCIISHFYICLDLDTNSMYREGREISTSRFS